MELRPKVLGYEYCACGNLVVAYEFNMLGKQCKDCFERGAFAPVREVALMNKARKTVVRDENHRHKRWPPKPTTKVPGRADRSELGRKARLEALRGLAHLYPDMFEVLLAQARIARGLPLQYNGVDLAKAVETYQAEHGYSAASTGGPAVDEPQPAQEDPPATGG